MQKWESFQEKQMQWIFEKLGISSPTCDQLHFLSSILPIHYCPSFSPKLTPRETLCLYFAALGRSSQETATLLKIKRFTVESHRKEIRRKLKTCSLAHSVYEGIRLGYLDRHFKNFEFSSYL